MWRSPTPPARPRRSNAIAPIADSGSRPNRRPSRARSALTHDWAASVYSWRRTVMKPETVGLSSARLARLDEVMKRRYVDGGYLPGMLTYVFRKGHLAHTGICGHVDIERGK